MSATPAEALRQAQRRTAALGRRAAILAGELTALRRTREEHEAGLAMLRAELAIAGKVESTLDMLSRRMLDELTEQVEHSLSHALQEVLQQPLELKATVTYANRAMRLTFHIARGGNTEDIMRGQGGSVANVLSVGLRFFALRTLDPAEHRPFVVLDEQDCWLRPDLVPALGAIIQSASRELGFQVLVISHHDTAAFERHCDAIYQLEPHPEGVRVTRRHQPEE